MVDVDKILSGETDMRTEIHAELTARACRLFGYDFGQERVSRIAAESRVMMDECGAPFPFAFTRALEDELVMYGEPGAHDAVPLGILGVVK